MWYKTGLGGEVVCFAGIESPDDCSIDVSDLGARRGNGAISRKVGPEAGSLVPSAL